MRASQFGSALSSSLFIIGFGQKRARGKHLVATGRALILVGTLVGSLLPMHAVGQEVRMTDVLTSPNVEEERDFGSPIAEIGDINNDGTPDLVIGAGMPDLLTGEEKETGRAYLIDGSQGTVLRTLTSPSSVERNSFASGMAKVGDIDEDGTPDLLVGSSREDVSGVNKAGRAYLFSGADGRALKVFSSPNPESSIPTAPGFSVGDVRNVSKDATPDLLAESPSESVGGVKNAGQAYIIDITEEKVIRTFTSPNPEKEGEFGSPFEEIGDVNGDGTPDLLIGATDESPTGVKKGGRVYIFSGSSGTLLRTLTSPNVEEYSYFGSPIAEPGDVNNDGVADLLIGSNESVSGKSMAGRVYLFSGANGDLLHTFTSPNSEKNGEFGSSISKIGDVNGDDTPDLLIGADSENSDGHKNAGRVYIFSGANWQVLHTLTSPNPEKGGLFGNSIAEIRNAGRGGLTDLLVGAFRESPGGQEDAGRVYRFQIEQQPASPLVNTDTPKSGERSIIELDKTESGVYKVPVEINGVLNIHMILDSGASEVSVSPDIALTLLRTGTVNKNDFLPSKKYTFANGKTTKSRRFEVDIKVGDKTAENVAVRISEEVKSPLLLGQNTLNKLGNVKIDYENDRVIIE